MRKIAGPGAVGGTFVDYDAITNPNGTVMTANWANDAQNELIGIQDYASIPEAAGTSEYVLAAVKKLSLDYGKHIGEMYFLDSLKTPTAFDKDNPDTYFNGKCLDAIDGYEDVAVANWPDLVPHLRAKSLTYNEGISGQKSAFDVTNWNITSNVATLTFANSTAEIAILTALLEDNLVHGSYTNWRSITLAGAIGDISAGEYAITAIDTSLRTIKFAFASGNNSGSGSFTANFYTNRIPGSTTTARVYEATGETLIGANYTDGDYINGLRKRDAMQRIEGNLITIDPTFGPVRPGSTVDGVFSIGSTVYANSPGATSSSGRGLGFDSSLSTSPNPAKTTDTHTRPNANVGHLYIHGRSYV